ncbi:dynamin family protein [Occultella gossypii]|uniref:Dynamin family protein n=1 Tax=Occultella gossypii TaxID=2800820 RepID=A0ABS7S4E7_9MICO|nr:dynamin family protein [Occultella gossypii]MBZ2195172.1 dynamin family protein [Occultella gossypii]
MESALSGLRGAIEAAHFPLEVPGAEHARGLRAQLLNQLDDYILPRYDQLDAPLLAVVGGSTGAGKSTLVNALVGAPLTRPGALRPTTRDPVLIHHPADARWFADQRILPSLPRVRGDGTMPPAGGAGEAGGAALRLQPYDGLRQGLALLDAPDIDSVVDTNRQLASQLLAAADLWIFVTTANRYADAVPWELLRDASRRQVVVAVVLDRVPPPVLAEISHDLAAMLASEGLERAPLFLLPETALDERGMLPTPLVTDLRNWLLGLTADEETRAGVIRQTLAGATMDVARQASDLAAAAEAQERAAREIRERITTAYTSDAALDAFADGAVLRGEVLARWQDFIGTGDFIRGLESRVGRIRDQLTAFVTGRPQREVEVKEAIGTGLQALLVAEADAAAERAQFALRQDNAGRALLDGRDWGRATSGFPERAAEQVRQWQGYLLDLVRGEGQSKRTMARILAFGVNGVGVALMIVVFASTGGLVGGEIVVAGGTAVVAQKVLEAIFGDQAVRRLATAARDDFAERATALLATERQRFEDLLAPVAGADAVAAELRVRGEAVLERGATALESAPVPAALGPVPDEPPELPTAAPRVIESTDYTVTDAAPRRTTTGAAAPGTSPADPTAPDRPWHG